jgi:hypothetical protein
MPPFPVPHLERRTFQDLPDEGTLLTETALLHLLRELLQPLADIAYVFATALSEIGGGRATATLVTFMEEILEQAVLLLEAWHAHQADAADAPDAPTAPPPRRRPGRSDTDA